MSNIIVNKVSSPDPTSTVNFPTGISGIATNSIYAPSIVSFDPAKGEIGLSTNTTITIVFDQQVKFSGDGTIYIRKGSSSGTIATSFTCGVSVGASINGSTSGIGNTIVLSPSEPLEVAKTYFVTLPSVGIANTYDKYYIGSEDYFFKTTTIPAAPASGFSAEGGDYVGIFQSPESPTGYYKYHVFTSTGILTTTSPTGTASSLTAMLVAGGGAGGGDQTAPIIEDGGGGGAGGLLYFSGPELNLPNAAGPFAITIGGGGSAAARENGQDSSIVGIGTSYTTIGGGLGGTLDPASPGINGTPGGSGGGGYDPGGVGGSGTPGQGFPGGNGLSAAGGGGGGAGGAGSNATPITPAPHISGPGGPGFKSIFNSTFIRNFSSLPSDFYTATAAGYYAGGGGGYSGPSVPKIGIGGSGGGGTNITISPTGSSNGIDNTGGGGAGGSGTGGEIAGNGGSGIFIIRYEVDVVDQEF